MVGGDVWPLSACRSYVRASGGRITSQSLKYSTCLHSPTHRHTHTFPKPHTSTDAERDLLNSERDVEGELLGQLQELHRQLAEVS